MSDNRSNRYAFVPFCMLCQGFQANGIVKYEWSSTIRPIVEMLMDNDINIIQMPCPESFMGGYAKGLQRMPKGRSHYNTEEFKTICSNMAKQTIDMVEGILKNGYEIVAIMGIDNSPSCAVNYQYTNKGNQKIKGFFIQALEAELSQRNINIDNIIGINRRTLKRCLRELEAAIGK